MNKLGIALAADSAVTLSGSGDPKIYQSADKLFLLSRADPVGVMIYGSATFMGVPWETIIKEYRRDSGDVSLKSVAEHAKKFMAFLGSSRSLFPVQLQRDWFLSDLRVFFKHLFSELKKALKNKMSTEGTLGQSAIRKIVSEQVRSELNNLRKRSSLDWRSRNPEAAIEKTYGRDIDRVIGELFARVPMTRNARKNLHALGSEATLRGHFLDYSGVVVAGFGSAEIFPSLISQDVHRVLANNTKYKMRASQHVSDQSNAAILPFAQREMVQAFMEGIDPQLEDFVVNSLSAAFSSLPGKLINALSVPAKTKKLAMEALDDLSKAALSDLRKSWVSYKRDHHVDPILQIVSILPKDEPASLAESLVNLTVLRRRTSTDLETVGGPIDVAVITKGDGFVWIKRKHYFDASLNPRYIAGIGKGGTQWKPSKPSRRSKKS